MSQSRVLLVITADRGAAPKDGPRKDYRVLAERLGAATIDRTTVAESRVLRFLTRWIGVSPLQAWLAFKARNNFDVILTDGEHIGLPLALLLKLACARVGHVTIGHRITAPKKKLFFKWLKVHSHISCIAVHSRQQYELAINELDIPAHKLALIPYQVDHEFWRPQVIAEERMVCSAGLEFRDYPTLVSAVEGTDIKVVIGAASHWSKRRNTATDRALPDNVQVSKFDYAALRELYARSSIVVVPLNDIDFQAGVTTILEAMSMAKAVIVTHSVGQTDVVEDRRTATRGAHPRVRPPSMIRSLAEVAGLPIEPTGFYVPPEDPDALRRAIDYLMEHPDERHRLGLAGRDTVERLLTVDKFAERMRHLVDAAASGQAPVGLVAQPVAHT
jgi:glycosyltransferase involved in cell wall biosynthesis